MAKFEVIGSFSVEQKETFIVFGNVAEGDVYTGMLICIPISTSHSLAVRITSIENVDGLADGGSHVGLELKPKDHDQLRLWEALPLAGQTLEISVDNDA